MKFQEIMNVIESANPCTLPLSKLFQPRELRVFRLPTLYSMPKSGELVDLSNYYIDEEGDMYSLNSNTPFTEFGARLEMISNDAIDRDGSIVNSLRGKSAGRGRKVTVRRDAIIKLRDVGALTEVGLNGLPIGERQQVVG